MRGKQMGKSSAGIWITMLCGAAGAVAADEGHASRLDSWRWRGGEEKRGETHAIDKLRRNETEDGYLYGRPAMAGLL